MLRLLSPQSVATCSGVRVVTPLMGASLMQHCGGFAPVAAVATLLMAVLALAPEPAGAAAGGAGRGGGAGGGGRALSAA